jgi:tRNA A-37 threonylcarbamoyl transferase component Bud32
MKAGLMDISNYIIKNSATLFDPSIGLPIKINVIQKRFTSEVYFCKVQFKNGVIKNIIIKHYDDKHPSRLRCLRNEYDFSINHFQSFNSEDISIPRYIHFDAEDELVVLYYIDDSGTLEKTLLKTHTIFHSRTLSKIFNNSGRWLACFHAVNARSTKCDLDPASLSSEIKEKWMQEFDNKNKIQKVLRFLVDNAVRENRSCGLSLLHKEYAPGNILHVNNKVYGIDFGLLEEGYILDDIAYFVISVLVLNKFPDHLFYKRIQYESAEIKDFYAGYLSYSKIDGDVFNSNLFHYFLYKNLIIRISAQLRKADQYPKYASFFIKPFIYNVFHRTEKKILSNLAVPVEK